MKVSKDVTFEVKKIGVVKAWTVYRFILAKSVYDPKSVSQRDVAIVNQLYLRFITTCPLEEEEWYLEHYTRINSSVKRLKFINLEFEKEKIMKMEEHTWKNFERHHHLFQQPLSPRAFRGLEEDQTFLRIYASILRPQNRKLLDSRKFPSRYVGVGYQDKGNARKTSEDASPEWQEVASSAIVKLTKEEKALEVALSKCKIHLKFLNMQQTNRDSLLSDVYKSQPRFQKSLSRILEIDSMMSDSYDKINIAHKVCVLSRRNRSR